tara:strand:- start:229 stop:1161 length:933 start_codon:yes stop_codon:yes gene_type:complete
MSIIPFKDKPEVDPGAEVIVITGSAGINTTGYDKYRQGINVRRMSDFDQMMVFYVSDKGIPSSAKERFDPSLTKLNYGHEILFETIDKSGKALLPWEDINGILNPVTFINDPLYAQYPVIMLNPNYLDPAMMNGVIEPLTIRNKLPNTSNEGPFIAHDTRAAMMPTVGPEITSRSTIISNMIEFYPSSKTAPYFDSQDVAMSMNIDGVKIELAAPGYAYPEEKPLKPFDDTVNLNVTDFSELDGSAAFKSAGQFTENPGYGVYGKSSSTGFVTREGNYVTMASDIRLEDHTGNQRVLGAVDSIAYGGLLK